MTPEQLKETLRLHFLWLDGKPEGVRADLSYVNLSGADLSATNLRSANLSSVNLIATDLRGANICEANLREAYLCETNLSGADLSEANLSEADLSRADLSRADLSRADLSRADLSGADLSRADLSGANLSGADLSEANLIGADLRGADLRYADLPDFSITPEEGSFIGFKKTNKGVVKLLVTENAKRLNAIGSRKCRASEVVVLDGYKDATGTNYAGLKYETGVTLKVENFNDDIRVVCAEGIHFFMTRKEADNWS
jgi:hypothetical protein